MKRLHGASSAQSKERICHLRVEGGIFAPCSTRKKESPHQWSRNTSSGAVVAGDDGTEGGAGAEGRATFGVGAARGGGTGAAGGGGSTKRPLKKSPQIC